MWSRSSLEVEVHVQGPRVQVHVHVHVQFRLPPSRNPAVLGDAGEGMSIVGHRAQPARVAQCNRHLVARQNHAGQLFQIELLSSTNDE
jgi:hypothetical protein